MTDLEETIRRCQQEIASLQTSPKASQNESRVKYEYNNTAATYGDLPSQVKTQTTTIVKESQPVYFEEE